MKNKILLTQNFFLLLLLFFSYELSAKSFSFSDKNASSIEFSITKFSVNANVEGKFQQFKGSCDFDEKNLELSNVTMDITASSVTTNDEWRDQHIKSDASFFAVTQFPQIMFKTKDNSKTKTLLNTATEINGDLTIKNIAKDVTFKLTYLGSVKNKLHFTATTELNRNDFGINWNADYTGNVISKFKAMFKNKMLADIVNVKVDIILDL